MKEWESRHGFLRALVLVFKRDRADAYDGIAGLLHPPSAPKFPASMADSQRHPFLHGLSKHRGAPPTVVVIFGASGDLTARKLSPAVYNLAFDGLLPADFFLVGYGRKPIPDEEFRGLAADAIKEFSRRELNQ